MKVYIVTSGTYSDYHIEAVFSTEEKAKAYIDKYGDYDDRRVEEYDTDVENTERETAIYSVYIDSKDTRVERNNPPYEQDTIRVYKCYGCSDGCSKLGYILTVEADSAERAKKIASERLMQVKAMPYLFPRLYEKCIVYKGAIFDSWYYPTYNFHTKEIILREGEFLKDKTVLNIEDTNLYYNN